MTGVSAIVFFIFCLGSLAVLASGLCIVPGRQAWVMEFLGKPQRRVLHAGLRFRIPYFTRITHKVDLMQRQVEISSQVKTKDDVFINLTWVLLYSVRETDDGVFKFAYKVAEPVKRLSFRVENEVRQIASTMAMEELFNQRDAIAQRVIADQVADAMESGLDIHGVTIEQPMPPAAIQDALNNKLAAIAKAEAAKQEAEAERIRRVGIARAEAESKRLQGEGIANERKAIAAGFAEAAATLREGLPHSSDAAILHLMNTVNQADMVVTAARSGKATIIFVPTEMTSNSLASTLSGPLARDVAA